MTFQSTPVPALKTTPWEPTTRRHVSRQTTAATSTGRDDCPERSTVTSRPASQVPRTFDSASLLKGSVPCQNIVRVFSPHRNAEACRG